MTERRSRIASRIRILIRLQGALQWHGSLRNSFSPVAKMIGALEE